MSSLVALPDPLREIVEDRVEELLRFRHWYRAHPAIKLGGLEAVHNAELRALVRLLRVARLQEKADTVWHAPEQADPVTAAKAYSELLAGVPEAADINGKGYWDWASGR